MAIALVKLGALATSATASVSPTFGQATTAGSLLIASIVYGNTVPTTTASGWTILGGAAVGATIAYKPNCGASETAPVFTSSGATYMVAALSEWSGAATTSPLDQSSVAQENALATAAALALPNPDATASDLCIFVRFFLGSKSATMTFTDVWTPAGGTAAHIGDDGATKQTGHTSFSYYLLGGHGGGAADTDTLTETLSTGAHINDGYALASFLPAAAFIANQPSMARQAVNRAASF